jgi:hypothetical protein
MISIEEHDNFFISSELCQLHLEKIASYGSVASC